MKINFGLNIQQQKIISEMIIKPFSSKNAEVFVFGSRARGTHHPFSDLDILYIENPENPIDDNFISQIKENLENSDLPFKVDLVNKNRVAKSYQKSIFSDLKKLNFI